MREHRLYHTEPITTGQTITLEANTSNRIRQVLRLKPGQTITVFDGSGHDYTAELISCAKQAARVRIGEVIRHETAPVLSLQLALGITRGEKMEYSLQKAVELGVMAITPLFTQRTLVQLQGPKLQRRQAHWDGIIQHACEQSGRSLLPQQYPAQTLNAWLAQTVFSKTQTLLLDPQAELSLTTLPQPQHKNIVVLVGPEGGLAPAERSQAIQQGFTPIRLGPRILRTETAPLAALAAIQTLWGDYR